jgi:hypothetical protein
MFDGAAADARSLLELGCHGLEFVVRQTTIQSPIHAPINRLLGARSLSVLLRNLAARMTRRVDSNFLVITSRCRQRDRELTLPRGNPNSRVEGKVRDVRSRVVHQ